MEGEACRSRKITWAVLEKQDVIRSVKMSVDAVCRFNLGVSTQFWRDVKLYGLDEAVTYLSQRGDVTDLRIEVAKIRRKMIQEELLCSSK